MLRNICLNVKIIYANVRYQLIKSKTDLKVYKVLDHLCITRVQLKYCKMNTTI